VQRYQDRISGPLLDRIDMQVEVASMAPETMAALADGESNDTIADRVAHAYAIQITRQGKPNQRLSTREIDKYCRLDARGETVLRNAMAHMHWSARAYHRVLKRMLNWLPGARPVTMPLCDPILFLQPLPPCWRP
jgi:magnesium chelatase family protein